MQEKLDNYN